MPGAIWMQLGAVPWQQWLVLAAASWLFALVCFIAASMPRRTPTHQQGAAAQLLVLQTRHRRREEQPSKAA